MCVWRQYVTYGNSGCGPKTHTALSCTSCCVGLNHTPRSHKSHIELQTHIIYYISEIINFHAPLFKAGYQYQSLDFVLVCYLNT